MASQKCDICGQKVEQTFLKKVMGTFIKDAKGKRKLVCEACQKKYANDKTKMLDAMK